MRVRRAYNNLMKLPRPAASFAVLFLTIALLSGCATTRDGVEREAGRADYEEIEGPGDPLEPFNRAMYSFNDKLDRYLMRPVARGYRAVMPRPIRRGITNFFGNLREPAVMVNNALQGKFSRAASDLGRFLTNTTFGVFGLFDVATPMGLERSNEDFGQTLGAWGVGEGPFLVLPFFGPSNFRDGVGLYTDYQMYPPTYLHVSSTRWQLYAVEAVDVRARLLDAGDILEQAAGQDPYVFVREAYRQRRRALIGDGAEPGPAPLDPSIFEDDPPR